MFWDGEELDGVVEVGELAAAGQEERVPRVIRREQGGEKARAAAALSPNVPRVARVREQASNNLHRPKGGRILPPPARKASRPHEREG
jgi:hypothetical protein